MSDRLRITLESDGTSWRLYSQLHRFLWFWTKPQVVHEYESFESALMNLASHHLQAMKAAGMKVPGRKSRRRFAQKLATKLVR